MNSSSIFTKASKWVGFGSRYQSTIASKYIPSTKTQLVSPSAIPYLESKPKMVNKSPEASRLRKVLLPRPGLVGIKRGMTVFYDPLGNRVPATIIEIDQNEVIFNKTMKDNGYYAVQVGCGFKPKNRTKALLGHFREAGVSPKAKVVEFEVKDESCLIAPGTELKADHFKVGQLIDVQSVCKGKGFTGVMRRWGFHGLKATHGVSLAHRSAGSTGQNTSPARVLPGKKMAGRMGGNLHTIQNLKILDLNAEKGYILVKGCVSGSRGTFIKMRDAIREHGIILNQEKKKATQPE